MNAYHVPSTVLSTAHVLTQSSQQLCRVLQGLASAELVYSSAPCSSYQGLVPDWSQRVLVAILTKYRSTNMMQTGGIRNSETCPRRLHFKQVSI